MRDPRVDPQPGDVLRVGNEERTIEELYPNGLAWFSATHHGVCMLRTFRKWAKTAEVVGGKEAV